MRGHGLGPSLWWPRAGGVRPHSLWWARQGSGICEGDGTAMCGEPRVAAECTCTEREFGRCSRPTVRAGRNVHDERDHCDGRDSAGARGRGSWPPAPMIPTWPGWSTVSRPRMGSSHRVREKSPARRPRVVVEDPPQSRPAPAAAGGGALGLPGAPGSVFEKCRSCRCP